MPSTNVYMNTYFKKSVTKLSVQIMFYVGPRGTWKCGFPNSTSVQITESDIIQNDLFHQELKYGVWNIDSCCVSHSRFILLTLKTLN